MTTPRGTVEWRELVLPVLANHPGPLFAGQGLKLLAKAAFLAARSLAQREVVMAACVTGASARPGVPCEDVLRGVSEMVAVDAQGRPAAIDACYLTTETYP